jgi:hypothetical protein
MEELEHILSARDIPFDAADNRIMYLFIYYFAGHQLMYIQL